MNAETIIIFEYVFLLEHTKVVTSFEIISLFINLTLVATDDTNRVLCFLYNLNFKFDFMYSPIWECSKTCTDV